MLTLPPGLDPDLLRSFVLVAEGGSVTRAAERVGRTQSAVSMQMKRLEEMLGQPLLARGGKGLAPTPHGVWLLERARRLLTMHDEIYAGFRAPEIAGRVRLGTPDDYALLWLPTILARFAETHPAVEVEVICLPTFDLLDRLEEGELDLTLLSAGSGPLRPGATPLWRGPLHWVGLPDGQAQRRRPLPLALGSATCCWRGAAIEALDVAGIPWRAAYVAGSQVGCHAVVLAGLAVTVDLAVPPGTRLRILGEEEGLPTLPEFSIALKIGRDGAVAEALAGAIQQGFAEGSGRS